MEEKSPADPPVCQLPELSPDEVHKNIMRCHRLRNRVDRKLLGWIHVLIEKRYAPALGSPDPIHYIMKNLQLEKSETYEVLGVARALPLIPLSQDAFEKGEISWSKLKQIALMAKEEKGVRGGRRSPPEARLREEGGPRACLEGPCEARGPGPGADGR